MKKKTKFQILWINQDYLKTNPNKLIKWYNYMKLC